MGKAYVHIIDSEKSGKLVATLCGLSGGRIQWTTRYQQSDCGKCRRISRGEK
jgi:hypothetical protein